MIIHGTRTITIFDTDFDPDDKVLLYVGDRYVWGGRVKDMSGVMKLRFGSATWFNLARCEQYDALFIAHY